VVALAPVNEVVKEENIGCTNPQTINATITTATPQKNSLELIILPHIIYYYVLCFKKYFVSNRMYKKKKQITRFV
jgi:hypothetical protein